VKLRWWISFVGLLVFVPGWIADNGALLVLGAFLMLMVPLVAWSTLPRADEKRAVKEALQEYDWERRQNQMSEVRGPRG
jgi:hypothetical protein